jgi:hypothetical protein
MAASLTAVSTSPANAPGSAAAHWSWNARRESGQAMAPTRSDRTCPGRQLDRHRKGRRW